jgi:hypothetical protein
MEIRARTTYQSLNRVIRKAALVADQVAVLATPVDTGRARGGWFVSIDAPSAGISEPIGISADQAANKTEATKKALDQAEAEIGKYTDEGSIFITNNVAYIGELDDGSSRQAPEGMTAQAVQAAQDLVRRANRAV